MKHTKGPWVIKDNFIESKDGYWIAALDDDPQNMKDYAETERANHALMCAAPELLEALEECSLWLMNNDDTNTGVFKRTQAAIAKAKGES